MAEEQAHPFFLSRFLCVGNLGQWNKKGSCHPQLPHYNQQRLGITALHNIHLLIWTILSTIPLEFSLQHLTTTLEKEGESCLLEDFPN